MKVKQNLRKAAELGIGLVAVTTLVLAGCGGGGSSNNGGGNPVVTTSATITPYKGQFVQGATVTIRDANGNPVSLVSGGMVNASGVANVAYNAGVTYPLTVEVTGNYYNEITGQTETASVPLRSLIPDAGSASGVPVTVVTETAVANLESLIGSLAAMHSTVSAASAVAALSVAEAAVGIPNSSIPTFDPLTHKAISPDTIRLAALAKIANDSQAGNNLLVKTKSLSNVMAMLNPASAPTSVISQAAMNNALIAVTTGASSVMAAGVTAPTPPVISTSSLGTLKSTADGRAATFITNPAGTPGTYETVTVKGLNRRGQNGTLKLLSNEGFYTIGETLPISADGTYTFTTPYGGIARLQQIVQQPTGQTCKATKSRMDVIDPYTGQLVTQNTANYYCFESPCGNLLSLGQAPAPKGLTAVANPDSSVTLNWQPDPWASYYEVYYGTGPNAVTTNPLTGFAVYQSRTITISGSITTERVTGLIPGTAYNFAVTSIYNSPADLAVCQSSASVQASATTAATAVLVAPTVTGLNPTSGTVGTTVTISGTNFDPVAANNTVKFAGTQATVTAASATSLTVTVPTAAVSGTVTVTTAGGTATSTGSFTVTTGTSQCAAIAGTYNGTMTMVNSKPLGLPASGTMQVTLTAACNVSFTYAYSGTGPSTLASTATYYPTGTANCYNTLNNTSYTCHLAAVSGDGDVSLYADLVSGRIVGTWSYLDMVAYNQAWGSVQ